MNDKTNFKLPAGITLTMVCRMLEELAKREDDEVIFLSANTNTTVKSMREALAHYRDTHRTDDLAEAMQAAMDEADADHNARFDALHGDGIKPRFTIRKDPSKELIESLERALEIPMVAERLEARLASYESLEKGPSFAQIMSTKHLIVDTTDGPKTVTLKPPSDEELKSLSERFNDRDFSLSSGITVLEDADRVDVMSHEEREALKSIDKKDFKFTGDYSHEDMMAALTARRPGMFGRRLPNWVDYVATMTPEQMEALIAGKQDDDLITLPGGATVSVLAIRMALSGQLKELFKRLNSSRKELLPGLVVQKSDDQHGVVNDGKEGFNVELRSPYPFVYRPVFALYPETDCEIATKVRKIRDSVILFRVKRGPGKGRQYAIKFDTASRLFQNMTRGKHRASADRCPWIYGSRANHLFNIKAVK